MIGLSIKIFFILFIPILSALISSYIIIIFKKHILFYYKMIGMRDYLENDSKFFYALCVFLLSVVLYVLFFLILFLVV